MATKTLAFKALKIGDRFYGAPAQPTWKAFRKVSNTSAKRAKATAADSKLVVKVGATARVVPTKHAHAA